MTNMRGYKNMNATAPEKYFNPFKDFGFKKLFGTEVNKDLLMDFLNGLICEKGRITKTDMAEYQVLRQS